MRQDCGDAEDTIHILALVKGEQHFVWLYTAEHLRAVLRQLGRYASSPEFPEFTHYDAAVLSQQIRKHFSDDYNGN